MMLMLFVLALLFNLGHHRMEMIEVVVG